MGSFLNIGYTEIRFAKPGHALPQPERTTARGWPPEWRDALLPLSAKIMTISENKLGTFNDLFMRLADVLAGSMTPGRLRAALGLWARLLKADRICLLNLEAAGAVPVLSQIHGNFKLGRQPSVSLPSFSGRATLINDLRLSRRLFGEPTPDELTLIKLELPSGERSMLIISLREPAPMDLLRDAGELLDAAVRRCLYDQALHARCRELGHVLNFSDSVYTSWARNDGWSYHNVNSFLALGYAKEDINISSPGPSNPMHPEDWEQARYLFGRAVHEGLGYEHEYRSAGRNGEERWFRAVVTVTDRIEHGGARQLVSLSRDITELRRAAEDAVEQAELEQWLVAQTNAVFSYSDLDAFSEVLAEVGRYLGVDRCTIRVVDPETGIPNLLAEWQEPGQAPISQRFPEMFSLSDSDWIDALIAHGRAYVVNDVNVDSANKRLRNYFRRLNLQACIVEPMIFDNSLVAYLSLIQTEPRVWGRKEQRVAKDIANAILMTIMRLRLMDELRASDQRYQLAMEHSTYGLWDRDVKKGTLYYSPHFYEQLGFPRKDKPIPLARMLDYIHPDDHHKLFELSELHTHSDIIDLELRHIKRDGTVIWMLSRGKVIERDDAGDPLRIIGMNLDITEHKTIQLELAAARQIAEEANRNKSEFLERMSHEIRTPMNAIMGLTYLVLDTALDGVQRNYLHDVDAAAKSLLHIIDDILDFSKIEAGELKIVNESFNLWEEVERLTKLHRVRAQEADNELSFHLDDDVPRLIHGDKYRLGQVLTNLLGNAVKFTSKGRIDLKVRVADFDRRLNTVRLLFTVSDSGIGFDPEQVATLFEPFVQAEGSTSRKFGGTGLGLSISKHLVEMMGGSIHCRSRLGAGTTFEFSVVFKRSLQMTSAPTQLPPPLGRAAGVTRRVLLVEDNPVNQRVASGILGKLMIETVTAVNGAEALERLAAADAAEFDAVLMDIEMPVLDGLAATRLIRKDPRFRNLPIIAMTAHAMVGDRERCLAAGMNEHIPKPVNPDALFRALNQFWNPASLEPAEP